MTRERPEKAAAHPTRTVAILAMGTLAYALQQTMILPALPAFQERYGVSTSTSAWLLTSFLLSSAVSTPLLGRLGDMYGKARMLLVALIAFGVGILLSAVAGSFAVVLAGRVVQGTGAAILPLAIGIVRDELPRERVAVGIGTLSSMAAPLVDIGLMRERGVWTTNLVAAGIGAAMFGSFVLIPQLAQGPASTGYGSGDSVAASGLVLLPGALVMLFAGPGAGRIDSRVGARLPLCIGCISIVVSYSWFAVLHALRVAALRRPRSWVSDSGSGSPPWPHSWSRPCHSGRPG